MSPLKNRPKASPSPSASSSPTPSPPPNSRGWICLLHGRQFEANTRATYAQGRVVWAIPHCVICYMPLTLAEQAVVRDRPKITMQMIRAGIRAYEQWLSNEEDVAALVPSIWFAMRDLEPPQQVIITIEPGTTIWSLPDTPEIVEVEPAPKGFRWRTMESAPKDRPFIGTDGVLLGMAEYWTKIEPDEKYLGYDEGVRWPDGSLKVGPRFNERVPNPDAGKVTSGFIAEAFCAYDGSEIRRSDEDGYITFVPTHWQPILLPPRGF